MPWFKVDDTAHTHPKLRGAGTAAIGLWTLGGSYASQYLTDGFVHAHFVKANATAPQLAKLVKAGLWHEHGHRCPRCPQPAPGDYVIHDYLDYNPSRAKVLNERERAAEKKRKQRAGGAEDADSGANRGGNGRESKTNRDRFEDESKTKNSRTSDENADESDVSPGDSPVTSRARVSPPRPDPSTSYGSTAAAGEPDIASWDTLGDLKRAIAAAGISGVSWNLQASQIERARQVRERVGVQPMVNLAVSNVRLKGAPAYASAWLDDWETLEAAPEGVTPITAANSGLRVVNGNDPAPQSRAQQAAQWFYAAAMEEPQ